MFEDRSAKVLLLQCPDPGAITRLLLISWLQGSALLVSAPSDWVLVRKKRAQNKSGDKGQVEDIEKEERKEC